MPFFDKAAPLTLIICLSYLTLSVAKASTDCQKTHSQCSQPGETRVVDGELLTKDCWEYTDSYECLLPKPDADCSSLQNACALTDSVCSGSECLQTFACASEQTLRGKMQALPLSHPIVKETHERLSCPQAQASNSCTLVAKECTSLDTTRIINGIAVTRDCWEWQETYSCEDHSSSMSSACSALKQTAGCTEHRNECLSRDKDGYCTQLNRAFICTSNLPTPLPNGVLVEPSKPVIIRNQLDQSDCHFGNHRCQLVESQCTDAHSTHLINNLAVTQDCWQWRQKYACQPLDTPDNCQPLRARCTPTTSQCVEYNTEGTCISFEHEFQCLRQAGNQRTEIQCSQGLCANGVCNGPSYSNDTDFNVAVSSLETARQMGVYFDQDHQTVFNGSASSCSDTLAGLVNCCHASGPKLSLNNFSLLTSTLRLAGSTLRNLGSSYTYDAISWKQPDQIFNKLYNSASDALTSSHFSFYGFSFAPGAVPPFAFDPTSFAVAIALQIASQFLECSHQEKLLGLQKGQNLCSYVGSWCSQRFLGFCLTNRKSYCCFNSLLAKLIHEQGLAQLHRGYGATREPNCLGFTLTELSQLDFSTMDLSAFYQSIQAKTLDIPNILQYTKDKVNTKLKLF
ncbi:MAG: conjugal transfer protein TraN [Gammaproteobacteria bacterium]|nr:conjugal transfer protein TraN [Gammaproteobacteria bacterium]